MCFLGLYHDTNDPYEIIILSFNMQTVLQNKYYNMHESVQAEYFLQARSKTNTSDTKLAKSTWYRIRCWSRKTSNKATEYTSISACSHWVKSQIGQGRASTRRKILQRFPMSQSPEKTEQPKLLPGEKSVVQITERPILQPPKIVSHPKMKIQVPVIQKSPLPKKWVKHVE